MEPLVVVEGEVLLPAFTLQLVISTESFFDLRPN